VVVDEYGSLEGIVTMGDLAGTVLGEEEPTIVERGEGSWLADGMIKFDEFLDHFPLVGVEADEYETLAGFLIAQLDRLPRMADRLKHGRYTFEIVDMDGRRIDRVAIMQASNEEREA
jgi:putative hemolysin